MRTYAKLLILTGLLFTAACASDGDTFVTEHGCIITQEEEGQFITCHDQSFFVPVHNYIKDIIDPCGNGPGHDEVLLVFDDGGYIAWYKHLGLVNLQPGVTYVTTDAQKCRFQVDHDGAIWYE